MIAVLRDLYCPNTLDCPEIRGPLEDGRVVVRGDKPDAAVLADHAVTQPLSDYVCYECEWGYVPNSAAGEQVRIAELTPALAQVGDFFVLDRKHVVRSRYDKTSRFIHSEVMGDSSAVPLLTLAELLWNQATNFSTWWDAHPRYHRDTPVA